MKHVLLKNGASVAVYFSGQNLHPDAVPLVLLHGFCEDSSLWNGLLPGLQDLPVIAIDLPGFGRSDVPDIPDMKLYAQTVLEILDQFELKRCVLPGHSLGGYVALEFAAHWPERLAGLGLFHSHPFADNDERKDARRRGIEMLRSGKKSLYVSQLFPNLFAPRFVQAHPDIVANMIEKGKAHTAEGIIAALQSMILRADRQDILRQLSCPLLMLSGSEDNLLPLDQAWKAVMLPDTAMVEILPGVAHMGMFEARERCGEILRTFYALCTNG